MLLIGGTVIGACSPCGSEVLAEIPAPGGQHRAVVFQYDCGATTGFSTQVSLLGAHESLRGPGNVFVADGDHGKAAAGPGGGPWVAVEWRGRDTLVVHRDSRARVFRADTLRSGVWVQYVQDARE